MTRKELNAIEEVELRQMYESSGYKLYNGITKKNMVDTLVDYFKYLDKKETFTFTAKYKQYGKDKEKVFTFNERMTAGQIQKTIGDELKRMRAGELLELRDGQGTCVYSRDLLKDVFSANKTIKTEDKKRDSKGNIVKPKTKQDNTLQGWNEIINPVDVVKKAKIVKAKDGSKISIDVDENPLVIAQKVFSELDLGSAKPKYPVKFYPNGNYKEDPVLMTESELAEAFGNMCNVMGLDDHSEFTQGILKQHRTLQQSIFKAMAQVIEAWSKLDENHYDARNEQTVKTCKEIVKAFPDLSKLRLI